MTEIGWAAGARTLENVASAPVADDFDLPPGEDPLANQADALVVERMPFALPVSHAQEFEALVERNEAIH